MNESESQTVVEATEPQPTSGDTSANIAHLAAALAVAQGKIKNAKKEKLNTFYGSKYADLGDVWDACRQPLSENGLAVVQITECETVEKVTLITMLVHASGEWIKSRLSVRPVSNDKKDKQGVVIGPSVIGPQQVTSALTYARRAGLAAMVGVGTEDDDGERGQARQLGEVPDETIKAPPKETPMVEKAKAEGRATSAYTGKALKPGEPAVPETPPAATPPAATPPPVVATESAAFPAKLYEVMTLSGVSNAELKAYLLKKQFIQASQSIDNLPAKFVAKMLETENWEKIVGKIKEARAK